MPFSADQKVEEQMSMYKHLKSGVYDIEKEERMLIKLRRSLGQRGDAADKIFEKLGITGIKKKI